MEEWQLQQLEMLEGTLKSEQDSTLNTRSEKLGLKPISPQWLAGYLDGEGCFSIPKGNRQPEVKISSANYDLLCTLFHHLGGSFYNHGYPTNTRRKSWSWVVRGKEAIDVVVSVLPYLREKQNQAVALLAWEKGQVERNKVLKEFITDEKKTHYEHLERK